MNPYTKKLDINRCGEEELLALDGVGAELAAAIILRRPYGSVLAVRSIPGVSAKLYEALRTCLHVEHRPPTAKLDLNTVGLRELLHVPVMTAEVAERILMLRPFADVAELKWLPEVSSEQFAVFVDWLVAGGNAIEAVKPVSADASDAAGVVAGAAVAMAEEGGAAQVDAEPASSADAAADGPSLLFAVDNDGDDDAGAANDSGEADGTDAEDNEDDDDAYGTDDTDEDGAETNDDDAGETQTGSLSLPAGLVPLPAIEWAADTRMGLYDDAVTVELPSSRSAAPSTDRLPDEMATFERPEDSMFFYRTRAGKPGAGRRALQWLGSPQVRGLMIGALVIGAFAGGLFYVARREAPVVVVAVVPTATAVPPTATTVPTQVPTPTAEPTIEPTPIGRIYRLRLSHYWPALGGTNCHASEWVDGECKTQLVGKPWQEWAGIGAACPKEIPSGTEISIPDLGRSVICVDKGGAIESVADGSFFIDLIQKGGFYLPDAEVIKDLFCPQSCFVVDGLVIPKAEVSMPGSTTSTVKADWFTVRLGHWWDEEWGVGCRLGKPLLGCNYKINGQPVQSWIGVGAKCPSDFELGSMVYVAVLEAQVTCLVVGEKRALDGTGFMIMLQPEALFLPAAQIVRDGDCPSSCFLSQAKKLVPNP